MQKIIFLLFSVLIIKPAWALKCENIFTPAKDRMFETLQKEKSLEDNLEDNIYAKQLLKLSPEHYVASRISQTLKLFKDPVQYELGLIRLYVELELLAKDLNLNFLKEISVIKKNILKLHLLDLKNNNLAEEDLVIRAAKYYETVLRIKHEITQLTSVENGALTFLSKKLSLLDNQPVSEETLTEVFLSAIKSLALKNKIKSQYVVEQGQFFDFFALHRDIVSGHFNEALFAIQIGQILNQIINPKTGNQPDWVIVFQDKTVNNLVRPNSQFSRLKLAAQLGIEEGTDKTQIELHSRNSKSLTEYLISALRKIKNMDRQGKQKKVRLVIMTESLEDVSMMEIRALSMHGQKNINLEVVFVSFENFNVQIKQTSDDIGSKTNVKSKYIFVPKSTIEEFNNSQTLLAKLKEIAKYSDGHSFSNGDIQSLILVMESL